ncbi:hypothetical protein K503DRAFT_288251 [Rhizopogon vinicolor AM-OR11-026]|uniref:Uncharacterized protein n=1 Tax=Rhizopogon vinicolor AM-OR11-026 TaxID=1314800 RepID=A0A1B7MVK9_9AGAM|nr:hypothetical protein K503DRAFT_288251 [Rhizopogon vinicolor AM-OR11-026]
MQAFTLLERKGLNSVCKHVDHSIWTRRSRRWSPGSRPKPTIMLICFLLIEVVAICRGDQKDKGTCERTSCKK